MQHLEENCLLSVVFFFEFALEFVKSLRLRLLALYCGLFILGGITLYGTRDEGWQFAATVIAVALTVISLGRDLRMGRFRKKQPQ